MKETKKVFPLRLTGVQHTEIKNNAEEAGKSMHQFVLDAATANYEEKANACYEMLKKAYEDLRGTPNRELELEIVEFLINFK